MEGLAGAWRWVTDELLGVAARPEDLSVTQMAARALVVFVAAIVLVRLGNQRFMGRSTALDVMLGIVFGSVVSRAITGNAPLLPTLAAGLVLVALHAGLASLAFRSHRLGRLVKGRERVLVRNGCVLGDELEAAAISRRDLREALRTHGVHEISSVRLAVLERNGDISVVLQVPRLVPPRNT
jgi:uncharacterized membrane protein YcaP (DUF421 family)